MQLPTERHRAFACWLLSYVRTIRAYLALLFDSPDGDESLQGRAQNEHLPGFKWEVEVRSRCFPDANAFLTNWKSECVRQDHILQESENQYEFRFNHVHMSSGL